METQNGLIDTHCHLDIERHFPHYERELDGARQAGVSDLVLAGVTRRGWLRLLEISSRHPELHAAPGLHPMYLGWHSPEDLDLLQELTTTRQLVAIGEVGLDYQVTDCDHRQQQYYFEAQVDIAMAAGLPLLLHVRKAHDKVLATLRRKRFAHGGIVHAYNGSLQQAEHFIKLGFKISVCGTITYSRARKIRRVAAALPLNALVLETDAPDIPPARYHGQANRPRYLVEILDSLTQVRSEERALVAGQTSRNAREILRLT